MRKEFLAKIVGIAVILCGVLLIAKVGMDALNNALNIPATLSASGLSGSESLTMPTIETFLPMPLLITGLIGGILLIAGGITYLYYPLRATMGKINGALKNGINLDDLLNETPKECGACVNYKATPIPVDAKPFPKEKIITVTPRTWTVREAPTDPTRYRPHRRQRS